MNVEYSLAMSELLCIINQSDDNYKSQIPQSFMNFIKENADETYNPNFDVSIPLESLNLRKETKGLLSLIYRSYICNEEQKIEFDKILKLNEDKMQKQLSEKYDVYKVFANRQNNSFEKEERFDSLPKDLVQYKKESIFSKIFNKIKSFFKRR